MDYTSQCDRPISEQFSVVLKTFEKVLNLSPNRCSLAEIDTFRLKQCIHNNL